MADVLLDAGEHGCGELVMMVFQRMKTMSAGQTLEVLAYDLAAEMDVPAWCRTTGNELMASMVQTQPKRFVIRKKE